MNTSHIKATKIQRNNFCMSPWQNYKGRFQFEPFNVGGFIHMCMVPCTPPTRIDSSSLEACGKQAN